MASIVFTNPLSRLELRRRVRADFAADPSRAEGVDFFWCMKKVTPRRLDVGDRVYYVEDGRLVGFHLVSEIEWYARRVDSYTGLVYPSGVYVSGPAASWRYVDRVAMRGFQGFRYAPDEWGALALIGDLGVTPDEADRRADALDAGAPLSDVVRPPVSVPTLAAS